MTAAKYRPPQRPASVEPALSRLMALAPLTSEQQTLIRGLPDWRSDPPGAELTRVAEGPIRLLTHGWAARMRWLKDGRRQIFNFVLVGDVTGISARTRSGAGMTIALTAVQSVDAAPLVAPPGSASSGLTTAMTLSQSLETDSVLDQVVRLGRQSALERMGHLILGLHHRITLTGMAPGARMPFPLTQEVLADATGLSIVHVNRVLQQLRNEQLVDVRQGHLTLIQGEALAQICDYRSPDLSAFNEPVPPARAP